MKFTGKTLENTEFESLYELVHEAIAFALAKVSDSDDEVMALTPALTQEFCEWKQPEHVKCTWHECAGCGVRYCDCTEWKWATGANGITYCSQECADEFGDEE